MFCITAPYASFIYKIIWLHIFCHSFPRHKQIVKDLSNSFTLFPLKFYIGAVAISFDDTRYGINLSTM